MNESVPIGPGTRVTLTFALSMESGDLIDGTGETPASFTVGDGNLLPGFESAIFGMKQGESRRVLLEPDQAFGEPNPNNVHMLRRADFASDMTLEPGLVVSFTNPDLADIPGVVNRVFEETIEIDFNHPLAGKKLWFEVDVLEVKQVSFEIARM